MSKKGLPAGKKQEEVLLVFEVDPTECPFREFRDTELNIELWGLGPAACRAAILMSKMAPKPPADQIWVDEQAQPLPRSVRQYLHGWIRAEELAMDRWEAKVVIFEENEGDKMSVVDMQLSHAQVLLRSSFCRRVLSYCFILERAEGLNAEHQWENFVFSMMPEGWRGRFHIYSPGMKSGGGVQHRPGLSRNGCYLVRLFYLGAWRCVWVSDLVPVDATDSPLLPFSPLLSNAPTKPGSKHPPAMVTAGEVYLWPLLLCKALLKLAAPDMNSDEETDSVEDELMPELDIMHALTGCMKLSYRNQDPEDFWRLLSAELPCFSWDDDEDTMVSTIKSKGAKKPAAKEVAVARSSMATVIIEDTKDYAPYVLPGITPGYEMSLLVMMARDIPFKKPSPEPEVALWKYYRWVDWAKRRGLYADYECPRTRFLRVSGLLKLSYAPHLLDVISTESLSFGFVQEQNRSKPLPIKVTAMKSGKDNKLATTGSTTGQQNKEELKEWVPYIELQGLIKELNMLFFPSMYEFTSAASCPTVRITKSLPNRAIDMVAPKTGPLYLQIDSPEENCLRMSLAILHPRVLMNSGIPITDESEPAYLLLERFDWFGACDEVPVPKAFVQTQGYDTIEVTFVPGRHFCRLWIHSPMNWHVMLISDSTLLLGSRDLIESAAVRECPWAARFLSNLGTSFTNWIRVNRSNPAILISDREFYRSYQPDLHWDPEVVGYNQALLHWMFRQALQSLLSKRLHILELRCVCTVLRHYFCDPDFGHPPKPALPKSLRDIVTLDLCDCMLPEPEETDMDKEIVEEQDIVDDKPLVDPLIMSQLLTPPVDPITSQVCELQTEELPCGVLKEEREKVIRQHEAATKIQACWRGYWARMCLNGDITFPSDVLKTVLDSVVGNLETLSALMNEFFGMYPGAKQAYSLASALGGVYGLAQHQGTSSVTPKCKWIPFFQVVFYCHGPVKVHFDIHSNIQHSTVAVYNNDTKEQVPQTFNAQLTFDFNKNIYGYTVMAHGTLNQPAGINLDARWQLTVLSSINGLFHVCDNNESCKEQPIQPATKLHIDEIFLPNRRNILGGILVAVTRHESISFRAAASSPDLEIVATLRTTSSDEVQDLAQCTGKGEIYWPYIRLEPNPPPEVMVSNRNAISQTDMNAKETLKTRRQTKAPSSGKSRSITKMERKKYSIEVTAPSGWPLTLDQWKRVDEVRNPVGNAKHDLAKKQAKDKPAAKHAAAQPSDYEPQPDDAYAELECSYAATGPGAVRRDDHRDLEFIAERLAWGAKDPGRNLRGAQIRNEFRAEYLEVVTPLPESTFNSEKEFGEELLMEGEEEMEKQQQGPTPVTESGMFEMEAELEEEETKYLTKPEQLKDKFIPLYFLPMCMKEKYDEESVVVTPEMAEAAIEVRRVRIEAATERMRELQQHDEISVQGRQKNRCQLLEKLFIDSQWCPELAVVLEQRDDAIALETLNRVLSANKKKPDPKAKK